MFSRPNAEIIPQRPPNIYKELTRRLGSLLSNGKGNIQINQMFFVGRFGVEHLVLHEPNERDFYTYDGQSGAWVPRTTDSIKAIFSEDWQRYAHQSTSRVANPPPMACSKTSRRSCGVMLRSRRRLRGTAGSFISKMGCSTSTTRGHNCGPSCQITFRAMSAQLRGYRMEIVPDS